MSDATEFRAQGTEMTDTRLRPSHRGLQAWRNYSLMRVVWAALAAGLMALAVFLIHQDILVRQQFEGKKWALPARVYAVPTELFSGAPITADQLQTLLEDLKFKSDPDLSCPGTYWREDGAFRVVTREFRFPDRSEPAREVQLRFERGQLVSIVDRQEDKNLAILRMEPVQIGSFYPTLKEDRILIKLEQAPEKLLQALFAVEDRRFYRHAGVSGRGILRALWVNARAGSIVQGGSTLTQQLVKNLFLSSERTWSRKISEITMALLLELHYSKAEILEAYLNEIYLGQDGARSIHGFGLASQYYFGRSIEQMELHQIALLVGMIRAPSRYDPWQTPRQATKRRNAVLAAMTEVGVVSAEEAAQARAEPLDVVANPHQAITRYPAFQDLVRRQLSQQYDREDLTSEGLRIFTTLDVAAQRQLESAAVATLKRLAQQTRRTGLETAAIVTRRETGEIVALVGSSQPGAAGFNRALDAERQIGSLIKPVVYLTALQQPSRYTLITPLEDTALRVDTGGGSPWLPKNYDGREHGWVSLQNALAQSYNLATIRLGLSVGVDHTVETLRRLGVERDGIQPLPSLLLGALALTPLQVTQMYQTLAGDGFLTPLKAIQAVTKPDGTVLSRYALSVQPAVDPSAVYLVNSILQEAVSRGTGRAVYSLLPRDFGVAGKTGTSNDLRDSWFAGFTGDYLGVVWVGRDDNHSSGLTGAQGALRVWAQAMKYIAREPLILTAPDNIEQFWIDRRSGLLAAEACAQASLVPFIAGSAPMQRSDCAMDAWEEAGSHRSGSHVPGRF